MFWNEKYMVMLDANKREELDKKKLSKLKDPAHWYVETER